MLKDNGNSSFSTCLQNDKIWQICTETNMMFNHRGVPVLILRLRFQARFWRCMCLPLWWENSWIQVRCMSAKIDHRLPWYCRCARIGVFLVLLTLLEVLVSWTALMILCFSRRCFPTQLHVIIARLAKIWLLVKWCHVSLLSGLFKRYCFVGKPVCDHLWPLWPLTPSY